MALLFGLVGCTSPAEQQQEDVHREVIQDAITQYEKVKKTNDQMEICVYAGVVTAAYVQASLKQEAQKWKAIEDQDCKKAGIPMA